VIAIARGLQGFQTQSPFFSDVAWTQHSTYRPFCWGFDLKVHDCDRLSQRISNFSNRRLDWLPATRLRCALPKRYPQTYTFLKWIKFPTLLNTTYFGYFIFVWRGTS
jgi:hypothetical protein